MDLKRILEIESVELGMNRVGERQGESKVTPRCVAFSNALI